MVPTMASMIRYQPASHWHEVEGCMAEGEKASCGIVDKHFPRSLLVAKLLRRFANAVAQH